MDASADAVVRDQAIRAAGELPAEVGVDGGEDCEAGLQRSIQHKGVYREGRCEFSDIAEHTELRRRDRHICEISSGEVRELREEAVHEGVARLDEDDGEDGVGDNAAAECKHGSVRQRGGGTKKSVRRGGVDDVGVRGPAGAAARSLHGAGQLAGP
ncbi:hypothetical protein GOP47_0017165 [Adiantum capillus-veneris]|uniref:Uncharacterized protein n=1 Tax=Adiantum capillus-veneris TaxID=13818 RepID=A0A9D4UJ62_ADICA|nr:hypothetical protein GOP47_0017165 [Adiantum capillus-veneris]